MAEISNPNMEAGAKKRGAKKSTRVDLTAMVDLGFLLITFFMLATTMSKNKAMQVIKPAKDDHLAITIPDIPQSKTLSLLLGKNDRIYAYSAADEANDFRVDSLSFSRSSLRALILQRQEEVAQKWGDRHQLFVMIKPLAASRYRNLVDALDEMEICDVSRYCIMDQWNDIDREVSSKTGNELATLSW
jgi:biopolymer transport protein ExbD